MRVRIYTLYPTPVTLTLKPAGAYIHASCAVSWREAGPPNHHDDEVDSDE